MDPDGLMTITAALKLGKPVIIVRSESRFDENTSLPWQYTFGRPWNVPSSSLGGKAPLAS
jgi:hypothetical protein